VSKGRQYPERPIVGVGALIFDRGKVLLIERAQEPLRGWWSLPGGAVELGERAEEALRREVREETGLEIEILGLAEVFDRILPDGDGKIEYHYVVVDWICRPAGGELRAGSDSSAVRWVDRDEIQAMRITSGTLEVVLRHWTETPGTEAS
jgi:mutator protein MutT